MCSVWLWYEHDTGPGVHTMNDFHHNSNSRWISFCSLLSCSEEITTKFCTWHDSTAVVPCAKFCGDMISFNGITLKLKFHQIWIMMEKLLAKWASVLSSHVMLTWQKQLQEYQEHGAKLLTLWSPQAILGLSERRGSMRATSHLLSLDEAWHFTKSRWIFIS